MLTIVIWLRTTPDMLVVSEQGLHEGLNPVPKHWAVPEALPLLHVREGPISRRKSSALTSS
jgi:hypothetical protein